MITRGFIVNKTVIEIWLNTRSEQRNPGQWSLVQYCKTIKIMALHKNLVKVLSEKF